MEGQGEKGARAEKGSRGVKAFGFDPMASEDVTFAAFGTGDGEAVLDPAGLTEHSAEDEMIDDMWVESEHEWTRYHRTSRREPFHPVDAPDGPRPEDLR